MAYTRFSGAGTAFGWQADRRVTLGGLLPDTEYTLVCERDSYPLRTDAQGAWNGQILHDVPLCVARADQPVLYDESRVNAASAAALRASRLAPPPRTEPAKEMAKVIEDEMRETAPVAYRPPSEAEPVDALPELIWPPEAEKLRPYFRENRPVRLLNDLSWRTVRAQEGGMVCCFGCRARDDRVEEVLYGVRAKGGLTPPRGLQGYTYRRMLDGNGYWTLIQRVSSVSTI